MAKSVLTLESSTQIRVKVTETILFVTKLYDLALEFSKVYGVRVLHESFINNLKDSLMHFRKMEQEYIKIKQQAEQEEIDDGYDHNVYFLLQVELLSEHLTRGIVDAYVEILQYGSRFYESFISCVLSDVKDNRLSNVDGFVKLLRKNLHFCKQEILTLRESKLDIFRIFEWDKHKYKGSFQANMKRVKNKCTADYEAMTQHLHTKELNAIYDVIVSTPYANCWLYHVKNGDTLEKISAQFKINIAIIRDLNKLNGYTVKEQIPDSMWLVLPD